MTRLKPSLHNTLEEVTVETPADDMTGVSDEEAIKAAHHFTFDGSMGGSKLHFQEGPIEEVGINGIQAPSVLTAIVEYLREISKPPHNSRETALAITKIEEAVLWLDKRTADRKERVVEGTSKL